MILAALYSLEWIIAVVCLIALIVIFGIGIIALAVIKRSWSKTVVVKDPYCNAIEADEDLVNLEFVLPFDQAPIYANKALTYTPEQRVRIAYSSVSNQDFSTKEDYVEVFEDESEFENRPDNLYADDVEEHLEEKANKEKYVITDEKPEPEPEPVVEKLPEPSPKAVKEEAQPVQEPAPTYTPTNPIDDEFAKEMQEDDEDEDLYDDIPEEEADEDEELDEDDEDILNDKDFVFVPRSQVSGAVEDYPDGVYYITEEQVIRKRKSTMRGRLRYAEEKVQNLYTDLVNHILTNYKKVNRNLSNSTDNYKIKDTLLCKISLRSKVLKLHLPLNFEDYDEKKFFQVMQPEKKAFEKVPFTVKVKSERALKNAIALIDDVMENNGVDSFKTPKFEKSFEELIFLLKGSPLVKAKKVGLLRRSVDQDQANVGLGNAEASKMVKEKAVPMFEGSRKLEKVELGELDKLYNDNDTVNIISLKKRNLISQECTHVEIVGNGTLTKSLKVFADYYDLTAIKMICLHGGKAVKYVEQK